VRGGRQCPEGAAERQKMSASGGRGLRDVAVLCRRRGRLDKRNLRARANLVVCMHERRNKTKNVEIPTVCSGQVAQSLTYCGISSPFERLTSPGGREGNSNGVIGQP